MLSFARALTAIANPKLLANIFYGMRAGNTDFGIAQRAGGCQIVFNTNISIRERVLLRPCKITLDYFTCHCDILLLAERQ
jgi:hypothetical protein